MDDRQALKELTKLPNIGPAMAGDLLLLGIRSQADLKGRDPQKLFDELCAKTNSRQDPCVLDTFSAIVDHANGNPPQPWWHFSRIRKGAG